VQHSGVTRTLGPDRERTRRRSEWLGEIRGAGWKRRSMVQTEETEEEAR
jgi:hypothetical protein